MKQLKLGSKWIDDVSFPKPHEIDVPYMIDRLNREFRFSGNLKALTIREHELLVVRLAKDAGEPSHVQSWADIHDHHEYVTGDIATPIKRLLGDSIGMVERAYDNAICQALGVQYPTSATRDAVKKYDYMAACIEWYYILGEGDHPDFERVPLCDVPDGWV